MGEKVTMEQKQFEKKSWFTFDTIHGITLDTPLICTLDTNLSQDTIYDSNSCKWILRFYGQLSYNYKLM